ncbi:hypothetical protein CMI37_14750 [Candidatus Pacearchaeota archaeon]|nr:hypothetical protein [Candidatus Pacearchaeota archaeon]|tara:strand:- start:1069 stop:1302 length:234 start_codon:yes stop_codon:yes gene_type:complete
MSEFYQTLMGRKFYEADVPRIVKALERIAEALEKQEITEEKLEARDKQRRVARMQEEMEQPEDSIDHEWENDVRRGR